MQNKFLALTLLALYLLALVQPTTPIMAFYANEDYFAANCENISRPELNCNGKCHLKKMMKQAPPDPVTEINRAVSVPVSLHLIHEEVFSFEQTDHPPLARFQRRIHPQEYFSDATPPPEVIAVTVI